MLHQVRAASKSPLDYCLPELALGRPRITQRPCVCVCLSVLTGKELCIYMSDFNGTLVTVHFYSLVVHCKIWKGWVAPFTFFWGVGVPLIFLLKAMAAFSVSAVFCFSSLLLLSSVRDSWLPLEALSPSLLPSMAVTVHWHSGYYRCVSTVCD